MIDANFNRAREGLRLLDDAARFGLDHAALCAALKSIRHDLADAVEALPLSAAERLAARDTPGDVGTQVSTPGELDRPGLASMVDAAAGRSTEALRVLEECAKSLGAHEQARRLEAARYRCYDAHALLARALAAPAPRQWALCVLITESLCTRHPWEHVARQAIAGGADCLQLREKALESRELLNRARRLVALAAECSPRPAVIINDRADIAALAGADGVHLGQADLPVAEARRILAPGSLVGVSTANPEQARRAADDGADYCGVGPMFPSGTKPKPALSGPEYLAWYLADPRTSTIPHLAISGIDADRARTLASFGCRGVAVSSAVCSTDDPRAASEAIARAMSRPITSAAAPS